MMSPDPNKVRSLLGDAIKGAGSQAKLGERAGYSQNAIYHAHKHGRVTAEMALRIHSATDGQVPKWELRPDIFPVPEEAA